MTTTYSLGDPEVKQADTKAIQARKSENARKEKIEELTNAVMNDTVDMRKAMEYCDTNIEPIFLIHLSLLAKHSPARPEDVMSLSLEKSISLGHHSQALRAIIEEACHEYAEHLYDEGNY